MTGQADFRVLGALEVSIGGRQVPLGRPKGRALLALLLLRANTVCSVDRLIADLWGTSPPASARAQVHNHISALRRVLVAAGRPAALDTRPGGYLFTVAPGELDLDRFRKDLTDARALRSRGDLAAAAAKFRSALDHWRGPALCDITVPVVRDFAAGIDQLRVDAVEDWAEVALSIGHPSDVIADLTDTVTAYPLRERLRALLIRALTATGRIGEAVQLYRSGRAALVAELGIEPGTELRDAYAAAIRGGITGRVAPVAPVVSLPADLDDFTGRADAVREGLAYLTDRRARRPFVLNVSGPAGVGKTTFAVHLAHRAQTAYPDGQVLIDLDGAAPDASPALTACLRTLGMPRADIPDDVADQAQALRARLGDREILFVLDGVTQERQVRPLLSLGSRCGFLLTSRRRLDGLDRVTHLELGPLSPTEGVAMLRRVVGVRVDADPGGAADVVGYCGGLPIALRVAAARLAARPQWTVADLVDRLADEHTRLDWLAAGDRAIRACLDTTYTQLPAEQQRLFRGLGLLTTPTFPSWIASAVLDAAPSAAERWLDALVDSRLVELAGRSRTGPRYRIHELLRLYARERATAEDAPEDRAATIHRMVDGWRSVAHEVDTVAPGKLILDPEPPPCWAPPEAVLAAARAAPREWREVEHACLTTAVRVAADHGLAQAAWPLAQRVVSYCDVGNRLTDWIETARVALDVCERAGDVRGAACMLRHLTEGYAFAGRSDAVLADGERAREAYAAFDPDWGLATVGSRTAFALRVLGRAEEARARAEESLRAARATGDPLVLARILNCLAVLLRDAGDFHRAARLADEAHLSYVAAGSRAGAAEALALSGEIARKVGDFATAEQRLHQAIRDAEEVGDEGMASLFVTYLARARLDRGLPRDAAVLAARAIQTQQRTGDRYGEALARDLLARATLQVSGPAAAVTPLTEAVAAWRAVNAAPQLAEVTALLHDARSAAGLAGAGTA